MTIQNELRALVLRFLGRLYLEWLWLRWRYLHTVSAGEYVEAVARHYRLVSQHSAERSRDDSTE